MKTQTRAVLTVRTGWLLFFAGRGNPVNDFAANLRQSIEELSATILKSQQLRMEFKCLGDMARVQRTASNQQTTPERIEPFAWFDGYDGKQTQADQPLQQPRSAPR
jgi:hypothetical protein